MSKNQLTGSETQSQRNRKLCQFNNDQYFSDDVGLLRPVLYINFALSMNKAMANVKLLMPNDGYLTNFVLPLI